MVGLHRLRRLRAALDDVGIDGPLSRVDSSVVAAMLIRAIGEQLTCVHVNHGLMRKNESESVVKVFRDELHANLIYVEFRPASWPLPQRRG